MCGFFVTSRQVEDIEYVTEFLRRRGPDGTSFSNYNGIHFFHALLSITGEETRQPFVNEKNDVVAIFNGEIYNYSEFGDFKSDGLCILPLYEEYGVGFIPMLDGEYAITILDFSKGLLIFSTDIFSTKPLFFAVEDGDFAIASYQSCLTRNGFRNAQQVPANSTCIYSIKDSMELEQRPVWTFCLNQHKTSYENWNMAFEEAIHKRTRNLKHDLFIGLSSGYDSGSIACELSRQNIAFSAYSILGSENTDTIQERLQSIDRGHLIDLDRTQFLSSRAHLKKDCEEYILKIDNGEQALLGRALSKYGEVCSVLEKLTTGYGNSNDSKIPKTVRELRKRKAFLEKRIQHLKEIVDYRRHHQVLTDDNGAIGLSFICSEARSRGERIYLSGSGADEIFSDYGYRGIKHFGHSTIGGHFIQDLSKCFPWKNFFGNTQRAYLIKEEFVSGSYGIEGRYPFLDRQVVQEFLWLHPNLKNQHYKAPLHQYLVAHDYPFDECKKAGFSCGYGPVKNGYKKRLGSARSVDKATQQHMIVDFSLWAEESPECGYPS